MKGLYEILTEKKWMINPDFVHGIRKALEHNLNTHTAFVRPERPCGYVTAVASDGSLYSPEEFQISEDGSAVRSQDALLRADGQTFPFVSVLTVNGPITRNGGACSYGSVDHRDMMIAAANHPLCRGHIFVINTPGGSAWAKNDYAQAIEYAHSLGQPVIAFIDGMCASAGMYLAALCDERYYMHPKDEVGCIGVMAAFYTEADGSKNEYSNETYHELYDPESFDKNREFRDIANDGNTEKLVAELAELGVEFRADVQKACPAATDEHLHGRIFNAEDVKGILVNGQANFLSCVQRAFALYRGEDSPEEEEGVEPEMEPANVDEPEQEPEPKQEPEPQPAPKPDNAPEEAHNLSNIVNMENYPLINAVCGLQEGDIVVGEEGAFMNASLLGAIEERLSANSQEVANAEQKATEAQTALAELQSKFDALNAELASTADAKNAAETALAEAKEAHAQDVESMNAKLAESEQALSVVKETLATAEQTIADKDAQIAALNEETGEEPEAGEAPESNGEGVKVPSRREFDPSLYKTNADRRAAFEAFKRGK